MNYAEEIGKILCAFGRTPFETPRQHRIGDAWNEDGIEAHHNEKEIV